MAGYQLSKRVCALEGASGNFTGWHGVIVRDGQTKEQATAAYEADHGPMKSDDYFLVSIKAPGRSLCQH